LAGIRFRSSHCHCHTKEVEISKKKESRTEEHKVSEKLCTEGEKEIFYQLTLPVSEHTSKNMIASVTTVPQQPPAFVPTFQS
jgi:hypothetical protein